MLNSLLCDVVLTTAPVEDSVSGLQAELGEGGRKDFNGCVLGVILLLSIRVQDFLTILRQTELIELRIPSLDTVAIADLGESRQPLFGPVPRLLHIKSRVVVLDPVPLVVPNVVGVTGLHNTGIGVDRHIVANHRLSGGVEVRCLLECHDAGLGVVLQAVVLKAGVVLFQQALSLRQDFSREDVFGILLVEVDLAADLLADTVLGAALNSAALQGLQGGANGFLLLVVVEVLLLVRSQRVSIREFDIVITIRVTGG